MDLHYTLTLFADILAGSKYTGEDHSSCDYQDIGAAIERAKEDTKAEIGHLLLELLADKPKKPALAMVK
jgi:hypothetical protein